MKNVLITGCSTGIGHAAAELFASKRWHVLAGSRHPDQILWDRNLSVARNLISPITIDVNDPASIVSCFEEIQRRGLTLDCVVNNAGYGLLLPFEDTPPEKIEEMFRTNVFGLMDVCRHAARIMRQRRAGTIINISSVIGQIGAPFYTAYAASKWAVEGFSESLWHEMRPFGVRVKIVEPGATKTEFHNVAYDIGTTVSEPYRAIYDHKRKSHDRNASGYTPPERVAKVIYRAATDGSTRLRYPADTNAKTTLRIKRFLPEQFFLRKAYERFIGGWGR